jgi:hypothetical protein
MSEQKNKDVGHPSGLSPSDNGQFPEELEGSVKAFRRSPTEGAIPHREAGNDEGGLQGPGGDSRPDDGQGGGFVSVENHPVYDTIRDPENQPTVAHEDPERLERQRVDQDDEIVAVYDRATDGEKAELRPRVSKKGAESEGL